MRTSKIAARLFLFLVILTTMACANNKPDDGPHAKQDGNTIQIGVIFDSFIIERWQRDRDAFVAKAKTDQDVEVSIQNANGDVDEQVRLINYFINREVDVLVIVPIDSDAISAAVASAKKRGIKVIAYDRLIKNADVDLYITFDNAKVGQLMAKEMEKSLPKGGSIFMMCGPDSDNNVALVTKGFLNELKNSSLHVVERKNAKGWRPETAYDSISEYLGKHKTIDAIMCGNDSLAGQAIHALSEKRLSGDVCVVGQDADLDACQRIVEGTQTMTVYKPVAKLAELAAQYAVQLAKGERIQCNTTYSDGTYKVPYVGLEPIAITKDNMNVLIEDGFHTKEDIYMNVK